MGLEGTHSVHKSLFLNLHAEEAGTLGLRILDVTELHGVSLTGRGWDSPPDTGEESPSQQ